MSGAGAGFAGLVNLAQMTASLRNLPGVENVNIKGYPAAVQQPAGGKAQLMLSASGYIMQVEAVEGDVRKEAIKTAADAVDLQGPASYTAE